MAKSATVAAPEKPADSNDLALASWQAHEAQMISTTMWQVVRRLPELLRQALRLGWQASRRDLASVIAFNSLAGLCACLGLVSGAQLLTQLLSSPNLTREALLETLGPIVAVVAAGGARSWLLSLARWAQARLRPQVERIVAVRLAEGASKVPLADFDNPTFHDSMTRARDRGLYEAPQMVSRAVDVLGALMGVMAAAGALTVLHPVLLPLLTAAIAVQAWTTARSARMRFETIFQLASSRRRKWMLHDLMVGRSAALEVRAFTMRDFLLVEYNSIARHEEGLELGLARRELVIGFTGTVLRGIGIGLVYAALGVLFASGVMPLSAAGAAIFAIQLGSSSLGALVISLNGCYESGLYFLDLVEFLEVTAARRSDSASSVRPMDGVSPSQSPVVALAQPAQFELSGVSFSYPGGTSPAVSDVSIRVSRGEMIALVGENGSGKSTVAKLIAALYDPDHGEIRWNGESLVGIRQEELWRHIGFIAQDFTHWPFSVRENITMGLPVDQELLGTAAFRSGVNVVVEGLDAGYDTLLDRRFKSGHELSKGQWQRIAAARAFYRDPALLICDEPTAALDARGEQAFLDALRVYAQDKAVILITHRLENVRYCDRAYVLTNGRVAESGDHDELVSRQGPFYELYRLQANRYAPIPSL
ncbi:ABC transporter ATP-binding protein [Nonomuraea sp. NPDC049637]|uniref:ABC transporter ATP-binding protein n=1 Tax=Nonomuraea sp. NPDC049637 TaxID=3154356 RepID=UPI0034369F0A